MKNIVTTSFEYARKSSAVESKGAGEKAQNGFLHTAGKALSNRATLPIAIMLLIFMINAWINPRIASYRGIDMLYSSAIPLVLIALGQMFLVISGGIDMGNGIAVGLTNILFAFVVAENPIMGTLGLALFVIAYGALGALIYVKRMPAIVVTLGASYIWRGIGLIIAPNPGGAEVPFIRAIFGFNCPLIPTPIVMAIVAGFVCWWIVKRSKYGMIICGSGNNPTAISRAGWSQMVAMIVTYMLAGGMLVLAGMAMNDISKGGDINSTSTYQMLSIATIILGGCEFTGGIASPVGIVAAAMAISSISTLLTMLNVDSNMQSAVTGLILIAALAMKLVSTVRRGKKA
ncbi:ABC transporter permease [Oscillibacter sp.]|uniref:ABC transporter permease n=1 Tax=Oscillibacter sp. TaxID=1945593 RepID=UPI0026048CCF|nr:ABC transporter permease [Oscillibacter sp.]MDD3347395.1 ABC transporter permease [Oscillibacter sp.]